MSGGKDALCEVVLPEIDKLLEQYNKQGEYLRLTGGSWSKIDAGDATKFVTGGMALIRRVAGADSEFGKPAAKALAEWDPGYIARVMPFVAGGLTALGNAVRSGYLDTLEELVHAEVFADFLDMAEHLLEQKYMDSAAVLVGGVLEGHLRKLCAKNNIPTEWVDQRGRSRPKKVETMNTELAKAGVYSTADQKNVTAWYGIRLDPAHGDYGKHTNEEVKVMLLGVREFVARLPA